MNPLPARIDIKLKNIAGIMKRRELTISVCESCTGGMLGALLTRRPGSSGYFKGGIIAYANTVKEAFGVRRATLIRCGAVSEMTAREMACIAREKLKSDIGVGITGIAGPEGGSKEKPVGLVYIAISAARIEQVKDFLLKGRRNDIRRKACERALDIIIGYLLEDRGV